MHNTYRSHSPSLPSKGSRIEKKTTKRASFSRTYQLHPPLLPIYLENKYKGTAPLHSAVRQGNTAKHRQTSTSHPSLQASVATPTEIRNILSTARVIKLCNRPLHLHAPRLGRSGLALPRPRTARYLTYSAYCASAPASTWPILRNPAKCPLFLSFSRSAHPETGPCAQRHITSSTSRPPHPLSRRGDSNAISGPAEN